MVSASTFIALAMSAASVMALPAGDAAPVSTNFKLQAKVVKNSVGAHHSKFAGTYVTPYHTAAGFNAATLQATQQPGYFYINGTQLEYNFANGNAYPAIVYGESDTYDDGWGRVLINNSGAGSGYQEFTSFGIDAKKGLIGYTNAEGGDNQFAGWRACDWNLNTAQLFFDQKFYAKSLPANCAKIELHPVYIS